MAVNITADAVIEGVIDTALSDADADLSDFEREVKRAEWLLLKHEKTVLVCMTTGFQFFSFNLAWFIYMCVYMSIYVYICIYIYIYIYIYTYI